jgi:flagellar hook-length control protein FliK
MFTAQHAEVKEAIEASIPRLREMLGTQQLNLINVNISQNSTSDQGRSQSQTFSKTPENREQGIEGVADTIDNTEHERIVVSKGLLSLYA